MHRTIIYTHYSFNESNTLITSDDGHAVQGVTDLFYHLLSHKCQDALPINTVFRPFSKRITL